MNLYMVISEQLTEVVWVDWFNSVGHAETYCIAELVVAEKPNQAKYIAWRADKNTMSYDVRDIPKMSCRRLAVDVDHPKGIVSEHPTFKHYWDKE